MHKPPFAASAPRPRLDTIGSDGIGQALDNETLWTSDALKALADPTRLRLVTLLSSPPKGECCSGPCQCGPLCVNALAHHLGITQSAVSQHLRVLKQAGLVSGKRRGAFVHYTLDKRGVDRVVKALRKTLGVEEGV